MEKIKTREYIRTKDGVIFKITQVTIHKDYTLIETDNYGTITESILKEILQEKSFNIRNILKEGDIVNGMTVEKFDDDGEFLGIPIYTDGLMNCVEEVRPLDNIKIKTILTHEQYDANCYRLED